MLDRAPTVDTRSTLTAAVEQTDRGQTGITGLPLAGWDGLTGKNLPGPPQGGDDLATKLQHLPDADKILPVVTVPQWGKAPTAEPAAGAPGRGVPPEHPPKVADENEPTYKKVGREALVLGGGLGRSFIYGCASLPARAPEIGASMAIGATLSTISKTGEFGAATTLLVGAYFTSKFLVSAFNDTDRWNKFGSAVNDTWHHGDNMMKNLKDVSDTGGNFAFDSGLSYASGYIGYKNKALADALLQVIKFPVPVPVPGGIPPKFPLPPALMGASAYMAAVPAPILYGHRPVHDSTPKDHTDDHDHDHDRD